MSATALRVDGLQYSNWSEKIFRQLREGGVDAVHVTIAYHENLRETILNIERWNTWFERYPELIVQARSGDDVRRAQETGRTAIIFGLQNPSPIEDDIGLVEVVHTLGVRFMQLSYNNQSLLASGCYESVDSGITRMGREVIKEMNRVGLVIDMSHSGERSTLEAIDLSERPITISHANPHSWAAALRNKSDTVMKALASAGGMFGFSLYPHHLKGKSACTLDDFCAMVARTADLIGVEHLGLGSDLCQDQPDSVVQWMRTGRYTKGVDYGEGSAAQPGFPPQPGWFQDSRDFANIEEGLRATGFSPREVALLMGENWMRFFDQSFGPAAAPSES
ncbi:peptidase M19 [Achromobacter sp. RTa]|uniref:membrane dipeptidase n=1 Tax=Achromobacter sp. RTa TaxID=1532557 RepID=UPI000510651D|nr:membrane dipeptidase [Achromobacter sp. RTa]KGD88020.1 peptidase M19 [Achromobacter sp. RTa]